jgi:peptidoglycan/LPS O-acetylase OafA/YrhL
LKYRSDIDGLRAISVVLVVLFHSGVGWFGGGYVGVDVFFVVSGFLITSLMLAEVAATGDLSLARFAMRRMRRLLPLASLVLLTTLTLGLILLPAVNRPNLVQDVTAAALYVSNWRFVAQATYFDAGAEQLVVHYWSLSIEEQFYLLWPLLVLLALAFARRSGRVSTRVAMATALSIVSVASFALSTRIIDLSLTDAYYFTHSRIWEMGVGAGLAFGIKRAAAWSPRVLSTGAAAGLIAILFAAVAYTAATPFPGYAAVVPVAGAAAVLAAGTNEGTVVARALSVRPLPYIGRMSYGIYLWHWPMIAFGELLNARSGNPWNPGVVTTLAVAAAMVLSVITHHTIENPIRFSPILRAYPRRAIALGVGLSLLPVVVGQASLDLVGTGFDQVVAPVAAAEAGSGAGGLNASHGGEAGGEPAVALAPGSVPASPMSPGLARQDWNGALNPCGDPSLSSKPDPNCTFGDPDGEITVALVGDSHAEQWFPALRAAADNNGWRLLAFTRRSCPAADVAVVELRTTTAYEECANFREGVLAQLSAAGGADVIIIGRSHNYAGITLNEAGEPASPEEFDRLWLEGAERSYASLATVGDALVQLMDTPWAPFDVPTCVSANITDPVACAFDPNTQAHLDSTMVDIEREAAVRHPVDFRDPTGLFCSEMACPTVTPEGIIVFRDSHHMTKTFSESLHLWAGQIVIENL